MKSRQSLRQWLLAFVALEPKKLFLRDGQEARNKGPGQKILILVHWPEDQVASRCILRVPPTADEEVADPPPRLRQQGALNNVIVSALRAPTRSRHLHVCVPPPRSSLRQSWDPPPHQPATKRRRRGKKNVEVAARCRSAETMTLYGVLLVIGGGGGGPRPPRQRYAGYIPKSTSVFGRWPSRTSIGDFCPRPFLLHHLAKHQPT